MNLALYLPRVCSIDLLGVMDRQSIDTYRIVNNLSVLNAATGRASVEIGGGDTAMASRSFTYLYVGISVAKALTVCCV
jgi:hypothetical protein